LDHTAKVVGLLDPATILKRGYTMTLKGNRVIKSFEDIVVGDLVTTRFSDGSVKSVVNIIDKNSDNEQDT
jgi:exodeoxyribonuclease VII large subunit